MICGNEIKISQSTVINENYIATLTTIYLHIILNFQNVEVSAMNFTTLIKLCFSLWFYYLFAVDVVFFLLYAYCFY